MKRTLGLVLFIVFIFVAVATADFNGSALLPAWQHERAESYTSLSISNISSETITIKVILYKDDGTILNSNKGILNFPDNSMKDFDSYPSDTSLTCTGILSPNNTANIEIKEITIDNIGYGVIRWVSEANIGVACIGYAEILEYCPYDVARYIPVNNGKPF